MKKNNIIKLLNSLKTSNMKARNNKKRQTGEGYDSFRIGALIQEARIEKGMTQEELAAKCGTTNLIFPELRIILKKLGSQLCRK
jgi:ribosome-binding protein aMBF1 (putative translation factor)